MRKGISVYAESLKLPPHPVLRRRASLMVLEVSAERRLVGKVHSVGYFLQAHVRTPEVLADESHRYTLYPLQRGAPAPLLYYRRKVVWRQVLLVGVILYGALTVAILVYGDDKTVKHGVVPVLWYGLNRRVAEVHVKHLQAQRVVQMAQVVVAYGCQGYGLLPTILCSVAVAFVSGGNGTWPFSVADYVHQGNDFRRLTLR